MTSSSANPLFSSVPATLVPAVVDVVCAPAADATAKRPDPASALNVRAFIPTPSLLIAKTVVINACPLARPDWPNQMHLVNIETAIINSFFVIYGSNFV
jgi:hypothetical protein